MRVHDFQARSISGDETPLSSFAGQVLLIVNVASRCGFTPQYEGLERLHRRLSPQGFSVLGFPCNQFGQQEPGDSKEIQEFCSTTYGVSFPMFARIEVNGPSAHPLYRFLCGSKPGFLGTKRIKWNFTKFLVNRAGIPVRRYSPREKPENLEADILRELAEPTRGDSG